MHLLGNRIWGDHLKALFTESLNLVFGFFIIFYFYKFSPIYIIYPNLHMFVFDGFTSRALECDHFFHLLGTNEFLLKSSVFDLHQNLSHLWHYKSISINFI